jgi:hypothetical protein
MRKIYRPKLSFPILNSVYCHGCQTNIYAKKCWKIVFSSKKREKGALTYNPLNSTFYACKDCAANSKDAAYLFHSFFEYSKDKKPAIGYKDFIID